MENEKIENGDSQNAENQEETKDTESLDALKEKYQKLEDTNRQLFERAKKAEGELKGVREKSSEAEPKAKKPKTDEFGLTEITFLKTEGIKDAEEVELAKKYYEEFAGKKGLNEVVENPFFKAELEKLRTAKSNAEATDNVRGSGGGGDSAAKSTPEYWIKRAVRGSDGKLGFPEDLPKDYKLRAAIMDKLNKSEKSDKMFYNS